MECLKESLMKRVRSNGEKQVVLSIITGEKKEFNTFKERENVSRETWLLFTLSFSGLKYFSND